MATATIPVTGQDEAQQLASRLRASFPVWQPVVGIALLVLAGLGSLAAKNHSSYLMALITGVLLGYVLVRSSFGFAGGVKRIYVTGNGDLNRGLCIMFALSTTLMMMWQWSVANAGGVLARGAQAGQRIIPGTQNVETISVALALGAILFGAGAIMAGACASGCLSDMGEGYVRAFLVFIFFVLFTVPGEWLRPRLEKLTPTTAVHLPQWFGYLGAILASLLGYGIIYLLVWAYEQRRKREGSFYARPKQEWRHNYQEDDPDQVRVSYEEYIIPPELDTIPGDHDGRTDRLFSYRTWHNLFATRWSFTTGGILMAVCWLLVSLTNKDGKPWGVTSAFTTLDTWLLRPFLHLDDPVFKSANAAVDAGLINDAGTIRNVGLVLGAVVAVLLAGRFQVTTNFKVKDALIYCLGGALMGLGARMANGCNIGALFSGMAVGSLSGWVFGIFLVIGAIVALKAFEGRLNIIPTSRRRLEPAPGSKGVVPTLQAARQTPLN